VKGLFITFEGTEGSGKSTQIGFLAEKLRSLGHTVRTPREPGGTPIGEEIRHTLKHSDANRGMTAETELLLMNASRAQLVRETILPALDAGNIVLCDRFYDSTVAYQGFGRGLDLQMVRLIISFAAGMARPDLTLLLMVPVTVSEERRLARQPLLLQGADQSGTQSLHDRMEEAGRGFFERVEEGYRQIAAAEPDRVRVIDATGTPAEVSRAIWTAVMPLIHRW
jgi:dTMP kinase